MPEENNSKKKSEDVLELLDSLDKDDGKNTSSKKAGKKPSSSKKGKGGAAGSSNKKGENDEDIMGFLDSLAKKESNPPSGKSTPVQEDQQSETPATAEEKSPQQPEAEKTEEGEQIPDPIASLSSWWSKNKSGLWSSATSAVKQAEARVRENTSQHAIDDISGRFGFFKSALSGVLDTIAPPIEKHEQLKIHIFHDMVGYPAIDTIVYNVFDRVMQQVEGGGELTMVVQKGKERHRRGSDVMQQRDLNVFKGELDQAKKLAAANIEDYVHQTKSQKEEGEESQEQQSSPVRTSDIYLSIQPMAFEKTTKEDGKNDTSSISPSSESTFCFVIYLSDPDHGITFNTVSQAFPFQWAEWLDKPDESFKGFDADPRDWVIDWVEEGLGLSVGIVAQSYVTKRMGVDAMFASASQ